MNRKIKFRGKLKEKGMKPVFFEGSLIHVTSTYKGEEDEQECNVYQIVNEDGVAFFVEEETIGQFTELYDKNEKEIWENDIVEIKEKGIKKRGVITWKNGCFFVKTKEYCLPLDDLLEYEIKVIGNITDNLELLGGE